MRSVTDWLKRHPGGGVVAVLILTLLIFRPAFDYGFVTMIDDGIYVLGNPLLAWSWSNLSQIFSQTFIGLYSPLPIASYMIDYGFGEYEPWCYHAQNIFWHLIGVWLVFVVMRQLKMRLGWALFFSCCYAIHPQRVESVVWVSERKDVLLAVFFWGACACFLAGGRVGRIGSAALTAAASLCKPTAIFIPVICYLLEVIRHRRWRRTAEEWRALLFPAVPVLLYFIAYQSLFHGAAKKLVASFNPALGFYNMLRYPGKILFPIELTPLYTETVFSSALIGGIVAGFVLLAVGGWLLWRYCRKLALDLILPAGIGFYLLLGPTLGFLSFSNAEFADRYSLLPSVMMYIAAGLLLSRCRFGVFRKLTLILGVVYLIGLGATCRFFMPAWSNDLMFFRWAAEMPNPSTNTLYRLADFLYAADDWTSLRVVLTNPRICNEQRGRLLLRFLDAMIAWRRDGDPAPLREFDRPGFRNDLRQINYRGGIDLYVALAASALRQGDRNEAVRCYGEIVQLYGADAFLSAFYRGMIERLKGNLPGAIANWEDALRLRPDDQPTKLNLEQARISLRQ